MKKVKKIYKVFCFFLKKGLSPTSSLTAVYPVSYGSRGLSLYWAEGIEPSSAALTGYTKRMSSLFLCTNACSNYPVSSYSYYTA